MKVGQKAPNIKCKLLNGTNFELYSTLKNGPVILNFIRGTWCPFCTKHLSKIRHWQDKIGRRSTMLIISNEETAILKDWVKQNKIGYLFISDPQLEIIKSYDVKGLLIDSTRPSTFLIDTDQSIQMIFKGIRTDSTRDKMLKKISSH